MMQETADTLGVYVQQLSAIERYKVLCGVIVLRPIAWGSLINAEGVVNVAPFSFFNMFSEDPPLFVPGLQHHADGSFKDTIRNVHFDGEFVVNLCDESMAHAMNDSAIDIPALEHSVSLSAVHPW